MMPTPAGQRAFPGVLMFLNSGANSACGGVEPRRAPQSIFIRIDPCLAGREWAAQRALPVGVQRATLISVSGHHLRRLLERRLRRVIDPSTREAWACFLRVRSASGDDQRTSGSHGTLRWRRESRANPSLNGVLSAAGNYGTIPRRLWMIIEAEKGHFGLEYAGIWVFALRQLLLLPSS